MRLLRTKMWPWFDIGLLKWSSVLFGAIAGAYFHEFVRQYVWMFLMLAIICAIRPAVTYFKD